MNHTHHSEKVSYKPLIVVLVFCLLMALATHQFSLQHTDPVMSSFMGYFFVLLSLFKFFDLSGFVDGFSMYDLITRKVRAYGYVYPFLELGLGLLFISSLFPVETNMATVVIMGVSAVGVLKSVFSKQKIKCACLGTAINVPLSTVSVIETVGMGLMALYNLL